MTLRKISDKDMRHCHFLKSTGDIGDPPSRAPIVFGTYPSLQTELVPGVRPVRLRSGVLAEAECERRPSADFEALGGSRPT